MKHAFYIIFADRRLSTDDPNCKMDIDELWTCSVRFVPIHYVTDVA